MKTNPMKAKLLLAALAAIGTQTLMPDARAGQETHGGDAVVCRDENGKIIPGTVESYDYFEAHALRGWEPKLGGPELSYLQKIDLVLERIKPWDPDRVAGYQAVARAFESNVDWARGAAIKDIQDSLEEVVPVGQGCGIEQAAIRRSKIRKRLEKKYLVSAEIWSAMSEDAKAGLVLHEIIYEDTGQNDSRDARYFNAAISSALPEAVGNGISYFRLLAEIKLEADGLRIPFGGTTLVNFRRQEARSRWWSEGDYWASVERGRLQVGKSVYPAAAITLDPAGVVQTLQVPDGGVWIETPAGRMNAASSGPVRLYSNGELHSFNVGNRGAEIALPGASKPVKLAPPKKPSYLGDEAYIRFHHNGVVASVKGITDQVIISSNGKKFPITSKADFYESGALQMADLAQPGVVLRAQDQKVKFVPGTVPLWLYSDGAPKWGTVEGDYVFRTKDGDKYRCSTGDSADFDERGNFIQKFLSGCESAD